MNGLSQNNLMVDIRRDLWKLSGPIPLLKKDHLQPVAQVHFQISFECVQSGRLHKLPGQPVPVLGHSHFKKAYSKVLLYWNTV